MRQTINIILIMITSLSTVREIQELMFQALALVRVNQYLEGLRMSILLPLLLVTPKQSQENDNLHFLDVFFLNDTGIVIKKKLSQQELYVAYDLLMLYH